ncbi:UvrD-helicase domain-containing protein [Akkermansiaceae bacterium]|nr:UvrD-helicase domain-containing protein [Akkermansiaceae bacterium]
MKLSSGVLRSLITTRWFLHSASEAIYYSIEGSPQSTIDYLDLKSVAKRNGTFSYIIIINTQSGALEFSGISNEDCDKFINEVERFAGRVVGNKLAKESPLILAATKEFQKIKGGDYYLNQSKVAAARESLPSLVSFLFEHPFFNEKFVPSDLKGFVADYKSFVDPNSSATLKRNAEYVAKKMAEYSHVFNTVEKFPLTDEQREAVVTEEDNILLIAAAGSGKSSTLVAKILYLLKEGQYSADQIIAFAYNKDAQLELTERIDELYEKFNLEGERVLAKTFHGFCMEVLTTVNAKKPSIAAVATAGKAQQLNYFIRLVENLRITNRYFTSNLLNYYSIFKHPPPREGEIESKADYNEYLKSLKGRGAKDPKTGSWRVSLKSISGVEVKSHEELRIANWLFLNGIRFKYEHRYDHDTADREHGQCYPDFYYPDAKIWHEHFAIDDEGKAPEFFEKGYEKSVKWKRALHKEKKTQLLETHSAHFKDGTIFERLDNALQVAGIPRNPPANEQLDELVNKTFNPSRDLELIITFLKHFKTNNLSLQVVGERAGEDADPERAKAFMDVFEPIYRAYESKLKQAREIDFEDLVNKACDQIESGAYQSRFKYLMVDEFQDASQDRLRLVKALAAQHKHTKIFGVGDDWQSIYRFSGADLKVMKEFPKTFGFTKQLKLTQTFRSVQQIVDVASEFVQRNPDQFKKLVTTLSKAKQDPVILRPYDPNKPEKTLEGILEAIQRRARKESANVSVFILTRYVSQRPSELDHLSRKFENITLEWKTVHASKGLEADYVIIHKLNNGNNGFPCEISDDILLDLVIPEREGFKHAEERRLLYVALTRAKRAVFGLYHPDFPSEFIRELWEIDGVKVHDKRFAPIVESGQLCPSCKRGRVFPIEGMEGPMLECNYQLCSFTTTIRCPECKLGTIVKRIAKASGKEFYACDKFPKCKHFYKMRQEGDNKVTTKGNCPKCKHGTIVKRIAKASGKVFYACDAFPKCKHIHKKS